MKIGIIGLPGSGKMTVFDALTQTVSDMGQKSEDRIGTIKVPDHRLDELSKMYNPKKTTHTRLEYFLPGYSSEKNEGLSTLVKIRDCDALIHVVRNFGGYGYEEPAPFRDFLELDQEMILSDLVVVEKRMERLETDKKRGKHPDEEERKLLEACKARLEDDAPLRRFPELADSPILKGFAFLTAKPMLVLFNNNDEDENPPEPDDKTKTELEENTMVIRGKLEQELSQMTEEEAADFLAEFNIPAPATDRVIRRSYALMNLISFFTVGDDEVRAWPIQKGRTALDAAETIHTDLKKGFIRAEVIPCEDLLHYGGFNEARKQGLVRLEGKTYEVKDGDIVHIRFNI